MKDVHHIFLKKSEESLNTARLSFEKEYYNSCVNRSYYAMFQAAVAVLFKAGVRPKQVLLLVRDAVIPLQVLCFKRKIQNGNDNRNKV
jgi:uncharacterized protein (UPF0332 family)